MPVAGAGRSRRVPSSRRISSRRAPISSPASASSPMRPSNTRSQKRRRARGSSSVRRTCSRKTSAKRASRPIAAGSARSISARSRRASAGAAPPVEMAMVIGARSTIAGMMKLESVGPVDDVHRQAALLGGERDARLQRLVVAGDDDQRHAGEIVVVEGAARPRDAALGDQLGDLAHDRVGDQRHLGAGRQQQLDLARRRLGAADDQRAAALQGQEEGKGLHHAAFSRRAARSSARRSRDGRSRNWCRRAWRAPTAASEVAPSAIAAVTAAQRHAEAGADLAAAIGGIATMQQHVALLDRETVHRHERREAIARRARRATGRAPAPPRAGRRRSPRPRPARRSSHGPGIGRAHRRRQRLLRDAQAAARPPAR